MQLIFGLENYLFLFSWFKIKTLSRDKNENDFFEFLRFINKEDIVLDIGANIGIMSYYMAKQARRGSVYAFEPIPVNLRTLRRIKNYFDLSNVHVLDMALGNSDGSIQMVMPVVDNVKKQGLSHVVSEELTEFNVGDRFETPIHKLDSLRQLREHDIRAIKMDVENFEFHVLEGARQTLKRCRPVVYCELWDNENRRNCFSFMQELDYEIKVKSGDTLVTFDPDKHGTQNFFFIPKGVNLSA